LAQSLNPPKVARLRRTPDGGFGDANAAVAIVAFPSATKMALVGMPLFDRHEDCSTLPTIPIFERDFAGDCFT